MPTHTPKVLAYCRASDPSKQTLNASIPQQISDAIAYRNDRLDGVQWSTASFPPGQPAGFFVDHISGWEKKTKVLSSRPAGRALLQNLSPGDHVIFNDVSRLGRNTAEVARIEELFREKNITMHFVSDQIDTSTPQGRFALHLKAAVAEWYSSILSARVREANAMKALRKLPCKPKPEKVGWENGEYVNVSQPEESPGKTGRVFRYIRCSHIKSYTSGLGLEAQDKLVTKASTRIAKQKNASIHPTVFEDDAISAYRKTWLERPASRAIEDQLRPGDHVVVLRVDRGWRTIRDLINTEARWRAKGVTLHIVDGSLDSSTAEGRTMLTYLAMAAEEEAANKSRYWRAAQKRAAENGRPHDGRDKTGYRIVMRGGKKRMRVDIEEMALMLAIDYLYTETPLGIEQTSDWAHSIYCMRNNLKPKLRGFRSRSEWNRCRCAHAVKIITAVLPKLRDEVVIRMAKVARDYLTRTIPQEFLVRGQSPNPAVVDARAFLVARKLSIGLKNSVTLLLGTQAAVNDLQRLHGNQDEAGSVLF